MESWGGRSQVAALNCKGKMGIVIIMDSKFKAGNTIVCVIKPYSIT
jgi:hypothetical protein